MHTMTPAFIPGMFSFSIVFGVLDVDLGKAHLLKCTFNSSIEEERLIVDTGDIPLQILDQGIDKKLPKEMHGFIFAIDFRNATVRNDGNYYTEIFLDGNSLGKFPIIVKGNQKL